MKKISGYIITVIQIFLITVIIIVKGSSIVIADNLKTENVKNEKSIEKSKIIFEKDKDISIILDEKKRSFLDLLTFIHMSDIN